MTHSLGFEAFFSSSLLLVGLVLQVAQAGLFCMMNYSIKYCSDFLELAEDHPAIEDVYLHKYFQIFIYFIWIDRKMQAATVAGSDFSINSNKIDKKSENIYGGRPPQ